jgi:ATP-binding cassette subfamily B protein
MLAARWQLCALMLGIAPLLLFTAVPFGSFIGRKSKEYQDVTARYSDISQEAISNMRTVRSFAAEDYDVSRYLQIVGNPDVPGASYCWWPRKDGSSLRLKAIILILHSTFGACTGWLTVTYVIFVVWYAFDLVVDGEMSFGALSAFLMYGLHLLGALGSIAHNVSSVFEARGASARIFEIIDWEPLVPNKGGEYWPEKIRGDVRFKEVQFSYPSRLDIAVLTGVSFHVHADSMAAFVGASGNGKSTILSLLQRFYEVTEGEILIDGVSLKSFDASWLRRQMAYVQQEPVLFGTSIRENLWYGCHASAHSLGSSAEEAVSSWSDEHLQKACEQANAYSFVSDFPEGFATLVGERGIKLSGGQKQRLAIARAIICDPRVLLLDEATSALDAESEHLVKEALDHLMQDRTRLVVAHRLSTVREADQIMVVEGGRIADCGRHEELLARCRCYEQLVNRQLQ